MVPHVDGMPDELDFASRTTLMSSLPSYLLVTPDYLYQDVPPEVWRLGMSPFAWCWHDLRESAADDCGTQLELVDANRGEPYRLSRGERPDTWVLHIDGGSLRGSYGYQPCEREGPCPVTAAEIRSRAESCRDYRRRRGWLFEPPPRHGTGVRRDAPPRPETATPGPGLVGAR